MLVIIYKGEIGYAGRALAPGDDGEAGKQILFFLVILFI